MDQTSSSMYTFLNHTGQTCVSFRQPYISCASSSSTLLSALAESAALQSPPTIGLSAAVFVAASRSLTPPTLLNYEAEIIKFQISKKTSLSYYSFLRKKKIKKIRLTVNLKRKRKYKRKRNWF